jgi:hypothetical protein
VRIVWSPSIRRTIGSFFAAPLNCAVCCSPGATVAQTEPRPGGVVMGSPARASLDPSTSASVPVLRRGLNRRQFGH